MDNFNTASLSREYYECLLRLQLFKKRHRRADERERERVVPHHIESNREAYHVQGH